MHLVLSVGLMGIGSLEARSHVERWRRMLVLRDGSGY
jgi:hypothetical protein